MSEEVARRLEFRLVRSLTGALDPAVVALHSAGTEEEVWAGLARAVVPLLADGSVVDVADAEGGIRSVASGGSAEALVRARTTDGVDSTRCRDERLLVRRAVRSSRPVLLPVVTGALLEDLACCDEHLRALEALDPRSAMVVPFTLADGPEGALTLFRSGVGRPYRPPEARFATALAAQASLAVRSTRSREGERRRIRLLEERIATAAHELRNGLGAVRAAAAMLADTGLGDIGARTRHRLARTILHSASGLSAVVEELDRGGALDRSGALGSLEPVHLGDVVGAAAEQFSALAERQGVDLCAVVVGSVPSVRVHPDRIRQVLANLIGNSLRHTPPGGTVRLVAEPCQGGAGIRVEDSGAGIPAEHLPRVFERRWRGPGSDGSGLGLAICREIVEEYGGEIGLESEVGRGTTVGIRLPVAEQARD